MADDSVSPRTGSSNIADLIEKGEISQIKEALEKSLSPGSQSFEQALYRLVRKALSRKKKRWPTPTRPPTCCGS